MQRVVARKPKTTLAKRVTGSASVRRCRRETRQRERAISFLFLAPLAGILVVWGHRVRSRREMALHHDIYMKPFWNRDYRRRFHLRGES